MYKVINEQDADISVCRFVSWYPPYQINCCQIQPSMEVLTADSITFLYGIFSLINKQHNHIIFGGHVANTLFRVETLKGIYFKNWKVEDEIFLFELSRQVKKVAYLRDSLYYYRQRPSSSIKSAGFNSSILEERLYLLSQCTIKEEIICIRQAVLSQIYRSFFSYFYNQGESTTNLGFVHEHAKQLLSQSPLIITSPTLTTTKLITIRLLTRLPICFLRVVIFICRNVLFLPSLYNLLRNLKIHASNYLSRRDLFL